MQAAPPNRTKASSNTGNHAPTADPSSKKNSPAEATVKEPTQRKLAKDPLRQNPPQQPPPAPQAPPTSPQAQPPQKPDVPGYLGDLVTEIHKLTDKIDSFDGQLQTVSQTQEEMGIVLKQHHEFLQGIDRLIKGAGQGTGAPAPGPGPPGQVKNSPGAGPLDQILSSLGPQVVANILGGKPLFGAAPAAGPADTFLDQAQKWASFFQMVRGPDPYYDMIRLAVPRMFVKSGLLTHEEASAIEASVAGAGKAKAV